MRKKFKKLVGFTTAVAMAVSLVPTNVFAEEPEVAVAEESAKENAKKIDKAMAAGDKLHPLAGIPIGIKDNISTKGIRKL